MRIQESHASNSKGNFGFLKWGLALESAIAAAWGWAKICDVKTQLSRPREPFQWKPESGKSVLLKNLDLVDVEAGKVESGQGILFEDGWITDVVSSHDLDKVQADRVFDCSGLTAIPGLINCHCHTLMPGATTLPFDAFLSLKRQALRNMEECAVRGVTTVRDASSLPLVLNQISSSINKLELLGPRVIGCASGLKAPGGYPDFARPIPDFMAARWGQFVVEITGPESGREAVQLVADQGARFVKLFFDDRSLFFGHKRLNVPGDETVRAVLDEAHRLGRKVGVHVSLIEGFRKALRCNVDNIEHMPVDGLLTDEDVEEFMRGDHCITPTITVGMCLGIARDGHPALSRPTVESMQLERERVMRQISPGLAEPAIVRANEIYVKTIKKVSSGGRSFIPMLSDPEPMLTGIAETNIMKLYKAGARLCCGNDGGIMLSWPGMLAVEMRMLQSIGMSEADVLRSATVNAAKLVGMEGELGTLEEGKLADVVLLSGNPLDDINAVEKVEAVFRAGVLLHHGPRFHLKAATNS